MKAGETHTVSFQLSASDLAFWYDAKVKKAEAGEFLVWYLPIVRLGHLSVSFMKSN